jgi:hypothetical protein
LWLQKYEERPSYDSYEDKKKYYLGVGEVFMGTFCECDTLSL